MLAPAFRYTAPLGNTSSSAFTAAIPRCASIVTWRPVPPLPGPESVVDPASESELASPVRAGPAAAARPVVAIGAIVPVPLLAPPVLPLSLYRTLLDAV